MAKNKLVVKRPERRVKICLDGELFADYEAAKDAVEVARRNALKDSRMNSPVPSLEKKLAELFERQEAETVVFRIRALPRHVWDGLKNDHPAREGNDLDEHFGLNTDTIFNAALSTEGSIVEVTQGGESVEFTHKDWEEFGAELTSGQMTEFATVVLDLNGGQQRIPFSLAAYKTTQGSSES